MADAATIPGSNAPDDAAISATSTTDALAIGTPCMVCGYDLRGLTLEHACPECGTPVVQTLDGPLLIYEPTAWLTRQRQACAMMTAALVLQLLAWSLYRFVAYDALADFADLMLVAQVALGSAFVLAVGLLLRVPSPAGLSTSGDRRLRQAILPLAIAYITIVFPWVVFIRLVSPEVVTGTTFRAQGALHAVAFGGVLVAVTCIAAQVAGRLHAKSLSKWTRRVGILAAVLWVAQAVTIALGGYGWYTIGQWLIQSSHVTLMLCLIALSRRLKMHAAARVAATSGPADPWQPEALRKPAV